MGSGGRKANHANVGCVVGWVSVVGCMQYVDLSLLLIEKQIGCKDNHIRIALHSSFCLKILLEELYIIIDINLQPSLGLLHSNRIRGRSREPRTRDAEPNPGMGQHGSTTYF
jgi:hypothetical protein